MEARASVQSAPDGPKRDADEEPLGGWRQPVVADVRRVGGDRTESCPRRPGQEIGDFDPTELFAGELTGGTRLSQDLGMELGAQKSDLSSSAFRIVRGRPQERSGPDRRIDEVIRSPAKRIADHGVRDPIGGPELALAAALLSLGPGGGSGLHPASE